MEQFASGWKQHYYGKGDVIVYRLNRDQKAPDGQCPVFGASVQLLVYGDAFWQTYSTGDNTAIVATDSMKNFIQRETLHFTGYDLEAFCHFLGTKFLALYPQVEGLQISASEIPYDGLNAGTAFRPSGPERAFVRLEMVRDRLAEATSGLRGFRLLRLGGSAFHGFVRDAYTTLPDIINRPLHMWLDVEWQYVDDGDLFSDGRITAHVRDLVHDLFQRFESGSIQQLIYQMGHRILSDIPTIAEVHLEANNRTWDTIAEVGDLLGVYTDARPPFGCLGLRLKR